MLISKFNLLSIVIPRYLTDSLIGIMDPLKTRYQLDSQVTVFSDEAWRSLPSETSKIKLESRFFRLRFVTVPEEQTAQKNYVC